MAKRGDKSRPSANKPSSKPAKKLTGPQPKAGKVKPPTPSPKTKIKKATTPVKPAHAKAPPASRPKARVQIRSRKNSPVVAKSGRAAGAASAPTSVADAPAAVDAPGAPAVTVPVVRRELPNPPAPIVAPGMPVVGELPAADPTPVAQAVVITAEVIERRREELDVVPAAVADVARPPAASEPESEPDVADLSRHFVEVPPPQPAAPAEPPRADVAAPEHVRRPAQALLVFGNGHGPATDEIARQLYPLPDTEPDDNPNPPAELIEAPVIESGDAPPETPEAAQSRDAAPEAQTSPPDSRLPLPAEPERTTEPPRGPDWTPEPTVHTTMTATATATAQPHSAPTLQPAGPGTSPNGSSGDNPPPPPLLFEIGWEVCWQLGGIYTVLKTKAVSMLQTWGDRYTLIGPYNPNTAALEFEEMPASGLIAQALDKLREQGIPCHYGRWLIPGRPRVILLDYRARFRHLDQDKYLMWADHHISTPPGDGEVNEVIAFGFTVAQFFQELAGLKGDTPVLAHFHEWMGGVAIPRIAHLKIPIQTIFTTHATLLGRYLASDNPYFYDHMAFLDPDAEAQKYQIYPRFQIEKAAAHAATVFTTVSEVTAVEASKLLGRMPEVILPNGLNIQRFAALHEFQNLHRQFKERIHEFVMAHFFPSYTFDLDNTLYFFTAGRYEYKNKGLDLYIEALHRLNQKLRHLPDRPTVVAFIVTKAAVRNISVDVLKNHAMFEELRQTCVSLQEEMGRRLFLSAATGRLPTFGELLPDDGQVRLKRAMHAWRTNRQPAYVTHDLVYDQDDPVLKHIRHRWFFNAADDPVKMVFHPEFVSATSPIMGLDYEQFVRGCHMGIFPSYYEPWGYTPMECIALGVPSVTSDLSGFGAYVNHHITKNASEGVYVLDRAHQGFDQAAEALAEHLLGFCKLNRRQRIELRNRTERLGEAFDWSNLVRHYHEAHALALERNPTGQQGKLEVRMV